MTFEEIAGKQLIGRYQDIASISLLATRKSCHPAALPCQRISGCGFLARIFAAPGTARCRPDGMPSSGFPGRPLPKTSSTFSIISRYKATLLRSSLSSRHSIPGLSYKHPDRAGSLGFSKSAGRCIDPYVPERQNGHASSPTRANLSSATRGSMPLTWI